MHPHAPRQVLPFVRDGDGLASWPLTTGIGAELPAGIRLYEARPRHTPGLGPHARKPGLGPTHTSPALAHAHTSPAMAPTHTRPALFVL